MANRWRRESGSAVASGLSRRSTRMGQAAPILTALMALALLVAVTGCANVSQGSMRPTPSSTSAFVPAPTTAEGKLALRVRQALGSAASSVSLTLHQATASAEVTITLVWSPTWKTHFDQAQSAAKSACYEAQAALWTSGVALNSVTVTILGQALDDYGSIITSAYAAVTLTSSSAHAIQWSTTTPDIAWSRYDVVFLRPLYGSDWMYPRPTTLPAS